MKTDKKMIVFAAVFILLVMSVVYRLLNPFVQQETDRLTYSGARPVNNEVKFPVEVSGAVPEKGARSLVEQFLTKPHITGDVYRELFSIYPPPQKKVIPRVIKAPVKNQSAEIDPVKNTLAQIREYITSYQWYGTYESQDKKAVFLAKNKMVLVAREGDRLDGKYLIEDIQDKKLTIKALDLNETLYLDMGEFNNE